MKTGWSGNGAGTPVAITDGIVFQAGTGYFEGFMNSSAWYLQILMSPDKQFVAGFGGPVAVLDRWHDVALTKQP